MGLSPQNNIPFYCKQNVMYVLLMLQALYCLVLFVLLIGALLTWRVNMSPDLFTHRYSRSSALAQNCLLARHSH